MRLAETFVRLVGDRIWLAYKGEYATLRWQRSFAPLWNMDYDALERIRLQRLQAILTHAGQTTRHYSQLFRELNFDASALTSADGIRVLPLLAKEELNRDIDSFLSNVYAKCDLICSSTGGSSGVPLTFYRDGTVQLVRRAQERFLRSKIDVQPGSRRAWVWGAQMDAFSMRSLKAKIANFLTERAIYFYAFDATPQNMDEFLVMMKRHRPDVVIAYPNMLAALAQRAQETNMQTPVAKVLVGAEPLHDWQRLLFRSVFSAETFEQYGSREIGTVASECYQHCGMHIFEPSYVFEVLDQLGNPVPNGQMGELVVTDLFNRAMPLVRYRTGDMVTLCVGDCKCGCTWRRITEIGGRVVDMILRPDGSKVEGLVVVSMLRQSGVRVKVQVVQITPESFIVRHLQTDTIDEDLRHNFTARLSEALRAPLQIVFEPVAQLPYDPSGKYRYVISQCNR